jgi:hypothetical protein
VNSAICSFSKSLTRHPERSEGSCPRGQGSQRRRESLEAVFLRREILRFA